VSLLTNPAGGISDGRKTVAVAGTREQLSSTATSSVIAVAIQAETDNTGVVVVGGSTVVATQATRRGIALEAGDLITLNVNQVADVWLDVTVSGDGVNFVLLEA